jgi:hypothetical protein
MPQQTEMTPEQYAAMEPDQVLRVMQIIAFALISGVVVFGGVASFIVFGRADAVQPNGPPRDPEGPANILVYLSAGMAFLNVALSFFVSNLVARSGVQEVAKKVHEGTSTGPKELFGRLLGVAQTRMIIAMALVEGAEFFCLIAFMQSKSLISLAIVGALLLVMAIHFPTKFKLARWLEDQQRLLS